jgi:hypothetical protein
VNVPMFTALRRVTIVFIMVEEYFLLGITPSRAVVQTVMVMCLGAAIAGWNDLTFDPVSYFYLFLTNLFTSLYTVYINVTKKETNLGVFAMMYYNSVTTMPALALLAWSTGDLHRAFTFKYMHDVGFQVNFQASVFLAFFLNVATFYCTTLNSARSQNVVGQLKNFVAFLVGLVLFNDYVYDHMNFVGLLVGFSGGVWYSYVTYQEKQAKAAQGRASVPGAATQSTGTGPHSTVPMIPPTPAGDPVDELVAFKSSGSLGSAQRKGGAARDVEANSAQAEEADAFGLDHDRGLVRRV